MLWKGAYGEEGSGSVYSGSDLLFLRLWPYLESKVRDPQWVLWVYNFIYGDWCHGCGLGGSAGYLPNCARSSLLYTGSWLGMVF